LEGIVNDYENIYKQREQKLKDNKDLVISYIKKVLRGIGTEKEIDHMINFIEENTLDPSIINLIFWDDRDLTAEQIYDIAMNYKPIVL
jgi:hypothetical protein